MTIQKRDYAENTYLVEEFPFGIYRGGAALCVDGKVRRLRRISATADTFFSVPAAVKVQGKTVSGFVSFEERGDGAAVVKFTAYRYGKNADLLPQLYIDA